jgi:hypothetical protein
MAKSKATPLTGTIPLPDLLSVLEIQQRLQQIFPESFPDRNILIGVMAARAVFVFLYGGSIEGAARYLRPSHIYLFTKEQATKVSESDRQAWLSMANSSGFRPTGTRWYADTSREPIRDDLMRNQLLRLGIMQKLPGAATTSSKAINYLTRSFADLFDPALEGRALQNTIDSWRGNNLDQATLQRMALKAQGVHAKDGDLLIDLSDGSRIRISAGPSSQIAKDLVEQFAKRHLANPILLWLSASDKKAYPQFVELSKTVGLKFNLGEELPDMILADMKTPVRFIFCEIVATDGPMSESRRQALMTIVKESKIPIENVEFLSAFEDREAPAFRKNFSQLALNSLVWFRTEPDLLVLLTTASLEKIAPPK